MRKADEVDRATSSGSNSLSSPSLGFFDRCLVDGDAASVSCGRSSRRKALGLSMVIEGLLLALVILAPLMTTGAQPQLRIESFVPMPLLGRRMGDTIPRRTRPPQPSPYSDARLTFPIGSRPSPAVSLAPSEPEGLDGYPEGQEFGMREFPDLDQHGTVAPPPVVTQRESPLAPLKLSEGVEQAQLISRVEPRYPPLAMQIHLEGAVRLHAIINHDGRISSLEVVSGHPLLVQAALDAVREWRYRPTMLDGEPIEVETTITVMFQLRH